MHVPESWLRREREREGRIQIGRVGGTLLAGLAALAALVLAVKSWMRGNCDMRALAFVLIVALLAAAGGVALAWPSLALRLKTTEPVAWQTLLIVSGSLLSAAAGALICRARIGGRRVGGAHGAANRARRSAADMGRRRGGGIRGCRRRGARRAARAP